MKNVSFLAVAALVLATLSVSPGFADSGGGSTGTEGGGDLSRINELIFRQFILSGKLNSLVARYVERIDPSSFGNAAGTGLWNTMMAGGLLEDVRNSKYIPEDGCGFGADPEAAASTMIPGAGEKTPSAGDVCFDVGKIVDGGAPMATLIALAIHEHVHHFGRGEPDAYLITQLVGPQILNMDLSNSETVTQVLTTTAGDQPLVTDLAIGTTFKVLQGLDGVSFQGGPPIFMSGGVYDRQFAFVDPTLLKPYCTFDNVFLSSPVALGQVYQEAETGVTLLPGSSYHAAIELSGGGQELRLNCFQLEGVQAPLTYADVLNALSGVFEIEPVFKSAQPVSGTGKTLR